METNKFRVGELARRTGLTVRTLHHWEAMGLLHPTRRTSSGHRLYGAPAVQELQRIRTLKALGLGLKEIREVLASGTSSLEEVLSAQRDQVREQLRMLSMMENRLEKTLVLLREQGEVPQEELMRNMEMMTLIESHFTARQLEFLQARTETLGEKQIQEAQEEWPQLIRRMQEEMEKGSDPSSQEVQRLAGRWQALIQAFSGGRKEVEDSLSGMFRADPDLARDQGLSPDLFRFVALALNHSGG